MFWNPIQRPPARGPASVWPIVNTIVPEMPTVNPLATSRIVDGSAARQRGGGEQRAGPRHAGDDKALANQGRRMAVAGSARRTPSR